ncbi:MAG: carbamate kinase [Candidatus Marinimicrobia bacterium]|nr:carbamate kinase [Candidatus Neomarinimicrobiota bacterium]|tara:strand:- start:24766 stop:25719 length:954 start_codon:yes stop_codon:yes gene_type:complete
MSRQNPTVIIALGGNALSPKSEAGTINQQFKHTRESLKAVMHFVDLRYNICITHGNGPQVGAELSKNEIAMDIIPPLPLNVLVANTQGAIGYMIQQSLQNALYKRDSDREVVTFISQMKINNNDQALKNPTKYIGKIYSKQKAYKLSKKYGWDILEQEKNQWRRVVPSPNPLYIFNGKSIKHLVDFGTIVIAGGGGGIPSYNRKDGVLEGIDGVVDKDKTAALLGRIIRADEYFIITDVDNIYLNYNTENEQKIDIATVSQIEEWLKQGHFGIGSMEPKIKSALYFLKHHGKKVVITSIKRLEKAIEGQAGTQIIKD